jgi:hypothetical protein
LKDSPVAWFISLTWPKPGYRAKSGVAASSSYWAVVKQPVVDFGIFSCYIFFVIFQKYTVNLKIVNIYF